MTPLLWMLLTGCDLISSWAEILARDVDVDGVPRYADCLDGNPGVGEHRVWLDLDGDGYGDPNAGGGCTMRDGYVANALDCNDVDGGINPETVWYPDGDGDGFPVEAGAVIQCVAPQNTQRSRGEWDCEDADPDQFPGQVWTLDTDGDGYGDPNRAVLSCVAPPGYLLDGSDCDDTRAWLNPDTVWLEDADQDGYASEGATSATVCEPPAGFTALQFGDCAESNPFFSTTCPWVELRGDNVGSCGLRTDGTTVCWSDNLTWSNTPSGLVDIKADAAYACGLDAAGALVCWAADGIATQITAPPAGTFTEVAIGLTGAGVAIDAAGAMHFWGETGDLDTARFSGGTWSSLSAANPGVCAVGVDQRLRCAGDPAGDGLLDAIDAEAPSGISRVAVGGTAVCALDVAGSPRCWGTISGTPEATTLSELSCGEYHCCGLNEAGMAVCWGNDEFGEVAEVPDEPLIAIEAGNVVSCGVTAAYGQRVCWGNALAGLARAPGGIPHSADLSDRYGCGLQDGQLVCWGESTLGDHEFYVRAEKIAMGVNQSCLLRPDGTIGCVGTNTYGESDPPDGEFLDVAVGQFMSCGVRVDGGLSCWGANSVAPSLEPPGGAGYVSVAVGAYFGLGLTESGALAFWGYPPDEPDDPSGFVQVAATDDFACGLSTDGAVSCWGAEAPFLEEVLALTSSYSHVCAITLDDEVSCWGATEFSYTCPGCMDASLAENNSCAVVSELLACTIMPAGAGALEAGYENVAVGLLSTCALRTDGSVQCWDHERGASAAPLPVGELTDLALGRGHLCALWDQHPVCLGSDASGQTSGAPDVPLLSLSAGRDHTCGLDATGHALCWGDDSLGQSDPISGARFSQLSAGVRHTCGVVQGGRVRCWGDDSAQQSSPPPELEDIASVSAGALHSCAVDTAGVVSCWGDNRYGQARPPVGLFSVASLACGGGHSCALGANGAARCWGDDRWGQVSDAPLVPLTRLSLSDDTSCGTKVDGQLVCWGRDTEGQASPENSTVIHE